MPFDVATISKFADSPPWQIAVGAALGGIVWKFFKNVGDVLNDKTNREIARWIKVKSFEAGVVVEEAATWPETFTKVFDRVFGNKHLSWKCFLRSCLATTISCLICSVVAFSIYWPDTATIVEIGLITSVAALSLLVFDYVSLLETRYLLSLIRRRTSTWAIALILLFDLSITGITGFAPTAIIVNVFHLDEAALQLRTLWQAVVPSPPTLNELSGLANFKKNLSDEKQRLDQLQSKLTQEMARKKPKEAEKLKEEIAKQKAGLTILTLAYGFAALQVGRNDNAYRKRVNDSISLLEDRRKISALILWLPTFFTSIWLWLYAASGFALKAARRFDLGFESFNSKADIDKKPLQAMGIVAGPLVTVLYWSVAAVIWLWKG